VGGHAVVGEGCGYMGLGNRTLKRGGERGLGLMLVGDLVVLRRLALQTRVKKAYN